MRYETPSNALLGLASFIGLNGAEVASRLGERVMEVLHAEVTIEKPQRRYITTPFRRASLPAQIMETVWVLRGLNDIDTILPYLPRAADFSDDGKTWRGGYGPRIRRWGSEDEPVDQVRHVLETLMEDRTSRRAIISIYDPSTDTKPGKDVPCNNWLTFQSRLGRLETHVAIRSNDLIWGWSGINQFEWSTLQEILAALLGVKVGSTHYSISSLHVYDRHWKKASQIAGANGLNYALRPPAFEVNDRWMPPEARDARSRMDALDALLDRFLALEKTIRNGMAPLHALEHFPEPMLRSWLHVLAAYWSYREDAEYWLKKYMNTDLYLAFLETPVNKDVEARRQRLRRRNGLKDAEPTIEELMGVQQILDDATHMVDSGEMTAPADFINDRPTFAQFVADLHQGKHKVYGDSWKRRGEMLGIMANIARKVDRLGEAGGGDTAADTVIDLMVYLMKYRNWLKDPNAQDDVHWVRAYLVDMEHTGGTPSHTKEEAIEYIRIRFDDLEKAVVANTPAAHRSRIASDMVQRAYPLALRLWEIEQHG